MRLPLLISLSLLPLAWQNAGAQLAPADDFFHSGAQFYISNSIPQAKEQVEMGLKLYPDDDKLKKLEELLKQQQQQNQQQQNQQNQQSKDQQQSQQQKSDSQKDQKDSQDQQKQDAQKQAEQKKADEEKKAEQQKADAEKKDEQKGEGQPLAAGQMTPEEAKRLLDAQKGNEQFLQLKPQDKPRDSRRPVKDW